MVNTGACGALNSGSSPDGHPNSKKCYNEPMFIFLIIGLLMGALVIIFAAQNIATVSVVFLTWQFEGSLALILILAVVAGMVIGWMLYLQNAFRKRRQINRLKNNNDKLVDELEVKKVEVEDEKSKLAATNAYLDDLEKK